MMDEQDYYSRRAGRRLKAASAVWLCIGVTAALVLLGGVSQSWEAIKSWLAANALYAGALVPALLVALVVWRMERRAIRDGERE